MGTTEDQIAHYYNWSIEYCKKVIFEYERFLIIKLNNINTLPSDDINKLWNYHILHSENYINYCITKFQKIINYDTTKNNDEEIKIKLINTLNDYKTLYEKIVYPEVWNINIKLNIEDLIKIENISKYPKIQNIKLNFGEINIYINYKNINENIILKPSIFESIYDLKLLISKNLNVNIANINILPHPELSKEILTNITKLHALINKNINFFIIEIN